MANGKLGRKFGFTKCNKSNVWDTFSIESAICGENDGLPTELDSISLSKYRKESLMAYGNAIVPQVAYEIFKAIEKFELMVKK
jgi:DNA (cytosine-5)-methyltransferase 1